jgi:ribosomal protein S18 acetylase RimI-like enzyme
VADVRFDAAAIADVTLARDWYESELPGLGEQFVDSVETAVSRIRSLPSAGSLVLPSIRRQFMARFPYVLYYRADDSGVLVIECLHVTRGPEYQIRGNMEIRPFARADTEAVVALWQRCDLVRPWNDPRKDVARQLRVQPDLFLVGALDGQVVATVMAGYEGHRGWVNYLAVEPSLQRRGLGRAMMAEAERRLEKLGCPKVNLQIRRGNTDVVAFYARAGYVEDDVISMGRRLEVDDP